MTATSDRQARLVDALANDGAKFTPGPWAFDELTYQAGVSHRGHLAGIQTPRLAMRGGITLGYVVDSTTEGEANAALIAAAPELFQELLALRRFIGVLIGNSDAHFPSEAHFQRALDLSHSADEALKKAVR